MKKISLSTFVFLVGIFLISVENVQAKTCSGQKPAPYMYEVSPWVNGPIFPLTTAASACKGSNTEVWFNAFRSLPADTTVADGVIYVALWEDDPPGNDDERVKAYYGLFYNRVVTDFYLDYTSITGNIDSEGDQTCELYLVFEGITGECCNIPVRATLFDYNICMN
ncbi:MAG: hypothetical protein PHD10_02750 [Bacilli bacterium]|nr:hypothetical protein [Bacilli bacterium]MDD4608031.1 hypothetical protein [Bacilli bacterium]